jgi:hypothetical protein
VGPKRRMTHRRIRESAPANPLKGNLGVGSCSTAGPVSGTRVPRTPPGQPPCPKVGFVVMPLDGPVTFPGKQTRVGAVSGGKDGGFTSLA